MIRPLALYIGLRYTRAKRRNRFISFISLASIIGIALGVTVLITVLSVMNGFDTQIKSRFFSLEPHITILMGPESGAWQPLAKTVETVSGVTGVAPFVSGNGMLLNHGDVIPVMAVGIDPARENNVSKLSTKMVRGSLSSLKPDDFNVVLGRSLATNLGVRLGDKINLFTPQATSTLAGVFPVYKTLTITGIFATGTGFGFESGVAYLNDQDAAKLYPPGQGTRGLFVETNNLYQAPHIANIIAGRISDRNVVQDWTEKAGAFFQALKMEKTMLYVILMLIVAVAVFNLVATLVMVVNDKRADIAILRTLGASRSTIMFTFVVQGAIVGLIGVFFGVIFGLLLAYFAPNIVNWIQQLFHVQFLNASVYFIDYLPSKIELSDVVGVSISAFLLSLIASIYPALLAFKTQPAEALRYE